MSSLDITFWSTCDYGGQTIVSACKYKHVNVKMNCFIALKDLKTFGEVVAFVQSSALDEPIVLMNSWEWEKGEWFHPDEGVNHPPIVHILNETATKFISAPVRNILGRVAILKGSDAGPSPNRLRAVIVPKFVDNDLNIVSQ